MDKQKQGKKDRAQGNAFEKLVRLDLESKGWIVSKWNNTVDFEFPLDTDHVVWVDKMEKEGKQVNVMPQPHYMEKIGKCVPAKSTWMKTPFGMRPMGMGSGFPDFIAYYVSKNKKMMYGHASSPIPEIIGYPAMVIFVEAKMKGILDKTEKEMARWYLENNYCSKFLIAYKEREGRRVVVKYKEFE